MFFGRGHWVTGPPNVSAPRVRSAIVHPGFFCRALAVLECLCILLVASYPSISCVTDMNSASSRMRRKKKRRSGNGIVVRRPFLSGMITFGGATTTSRCRCPLSSLALLLLLLLAAVAPRPGMATHHSFYMKDGPSLIGPVGVPFGFLDTGYYELNVYDFELTERSGEGEEEPEVLSTLEAGFFLKRYESEAHFNQHFDQLKANRSLCSFEYFREKAEDELPFDDDDFDEWNQVVKDAEHGILLKLKGRDVLSGAVTSKPINITYDFHKGEAGLYFLIYQVCPYDPKIMSTFELDFHFINYDKFRNATYLTAGELRLPLIFFFFSMSYLGLFIIWTVNNRQIQNGLPGLFHNCNVGNRSRGPGGRGGSTQPIVYPIHHLMGALVLFKFFATFFESIRYHAIRVTGHAELWSVVYYIFAFIKGTFLFIVILLIGTGWSFVKPFLNDREKKVVLAILCLQVANNIALIVLSHLTEGESRYEGWTAVLHLVDILCCCAVLVPIVWQVNMLEKSIGDDGGGSGDDDNDLRDDELDDVDLNGGHQESSETDYGEKGQILNKLKLFRSFYLLVVAYIYATRILVYLFASLLSFKHLWVRHFVVELITLSFYVAVGTMFRPMAANPYLSVKKYERVSAVEMIDQDD